jgi:hypothetical protein
MLSLVRLAIILSFATACSFSHGVEPIDSSDAPPPPDVPTLTWAVDNTSKKGVPATPKEWSDVLAAAGLAISPPSHLWLMQETSGGLQDSIANDTLSPVNGPTYGNVLAGWTRKAVGTTDTTINQGFMSTAVGNLNGTSHLLLLYVAITSTPGGTRSVAALGANNDHRFIGITSTPVYEATGIGVTPFAGTINPGTMVHPVLLQVDSTNQHYVVYTDQEKLEAPWSAPQGQGNLLVIGNASFGAAPARYLYGTMWTGAGAELNDGQVKTLLQRLGWTVTGY